MKIYKMKDITTYVNEALRIKSDTKVASVNDTEKEDFLNDFKQYVQETIDDWMHSYDDTREDMEQLRDDLDCADETILDNFDDFIEKYNYEDNEIADEIDFRNELKPIIDEYVKSTKEYLSEKRSKWNDKW